MLEDFRETSEANIYTESTSIKLIFLIFFSLFKILFFWFVFWRGGNLSNLFVINIASCSPISQSLIWMEVVGDGSKC